MNDPYFDARVERDVAARLAQDAIDTGSTDELVARVVQVEARVIAEFLRSAPALAVLLRHDLTDDPGFCGGCNRGHGGYASHLLDELARAVDR